MKGMTLNEIVHRADEEVKPVDRVTEQELVESLRGMDPTAFENIFGGEK